MAKRYYNVHFQYSETTYCSNIAHAESIQDVKKHYSKYSWVSVEEATESDIQEAQRKGKPIVEIESTPEEAETASTTGQPESVEVLAGFDGKFERIARTFATVEEAKKALDKAFGKSTNGIWTDSLKQQFTISRDHKEKPKTSDRPNFADDLEKWTQGASASNSVIEAYNKDLITLFEALENIEKSHTEDAKKDPDIIATRIYNLDIFGNRDSDITPENIKTYIESDPLETILYLLDMIDEMQA